MRRLPMILLLVVLALAGCGGDPLAGGEPAPDVGAGTDGGSDGGSGDAGDSGGSGDSGDDSPAPEEVDNPDEGDAGGGGASVELPGLPIGGDSVDFSEANPACARVNWTGGQLPDAARVRITGFSVPEQFEVDGTACGDLPPCLDDGWLDAAGSACSVTVVWSGEQPAEDESPQLSASSGIVTCEVAEDCDLAHDLAADGGLQAIDLFVPFVDSGTDEESGVEEESGVDESGVDESGVDEEPGVDEPEVGDESGADVGSDTDQPDTESE